MAHEFNIGQELMTEEFGRVKVIALYKVDWMDSEHLNKISNYVVCVFDGVVYYSCFPNEITITEVIKY